MSTSFRTFDSTTTLTVSEGYDLTNQHHYLKRRFQWACGALNRKVTFRVWRLLLFLFIVLMIMLLVGLLTVMYCPGDAKLAHSKRIEPGDAEGTTTKKPIGKTEPPSSTEATPSVKPTSSLQKTVQVTTTSVSPTSKVTTQTTTGPKATQDTTTAQPTTTEKPTTTKKPTTTEKPTSAVQPATKEKVTTTTTAQLTTTDKPTTPALPTNSAPTTTAQASTAEKPSTTALTTTAQITTAAAVNATAILTTAISTATDAPTTAAPTTVGPTTAPHKKFLECGTAIIGAGTGGLLTAYTLLLNENETNVCIFERGDHPGGKLFDFNFPEVPNVIVGLGQWNVYGGNYDEAEFAHSLGVSLDSWVTKTTRVEARGRFTDSFDFLKPEAFPTLPNQAPTNQTTANIAKYISSNQRKYKQYSTAEMFLSKELTPEGAEFMADAFGLKGDYMQEINPDSYRTYLKHQEYLTNDNGDDARPIKGMSELIIELRKKVENLGGRIYLKETVTTVDKIQDKYVLRTTSRTARTNKTIITVGPTALKKIKGDVILNITDHQIFNSIVSVPAFFGAALYDKAWWNDTTDNSLQPLEMFISSSDCLGITMPYKGVGPNGKVVLHTIANNGGCSDRWGKIYRISEDEINKELTRALKYKFQRDNIPQPLKTIYKYWQEGFWYFQKAGTNFNLTTVRRWAKRPLTGQDVFLVDRAFNNFGGWLQDTLRSANDALVEGWSVQLPFDVYV